MYWRQHRGTSEEQDWHRGRPTKPDRGLNLPTTLSELKAVQSPCACQKISGTATLIPARVLCFRGLATNSLRERSPLPRSCFLGGCARFSCPLPMTMCLAHLSSTCDDDNASSSSYLMTTRSRSSPPSLLYHLQVVPTTATGACLRSSTT